MKYKCEICGCKTDKPGNCCGQPMTRMPERKGRGKKR